MTTTCLSIHDGPIDLSKLEDAVSFIETIIAALRVGQGRLDGDSVVRVDRDEKPAIMLQRNWQVTDVIRLNMWEQRCRPVVNLAIRGCQDHPLHPDPPRELLPAHSLAILETVLPFLKNVRHASDAAMDAIDQRLHAISAMHGWDGTIIAPSICGDISHTKPLSGGTAEITELDRCETDTLWTSVPRLNVIRIDFPPSGATGLTLDTYRLMLEHHPDPVERMRLIATLPSGSTDKEESPE